MMRALVLVALVYSLPALGQQQAPPSFPIATKGDETDQMRANDAPCYAKMQAMTSRPVGKNRVTFMRDCKANGP
jgi:hypothetical protein